MSSQSSKAAWLIQEKAKPFVIQQAPDDPLSQNEIIVKNHTVAINPVDWMIQDLAIFPLTYPTILGYDIAGEVVAVGSLAASKFAVGDRVAGHAISLETGESKHGGFQLYTHLLTNMAVRIPSSISFESAVVMPLCLSTAMACLFTKGSGLGLQYPPLDLDPAPKKEVILVWGGASCVGCNTIQLATQTGYEVIATASPRNFELLERLGAAQVCDYHSVTIESDLLHALAGRTLAGSVDTIVKDGSLRHLAAVVEKSTGSKHIATTLPPQSLPQGVTAQMAVAFTVKDDEIAGYLYNEYLPKALSLGKFVPAPDPEVVGHGLVAIQEAVELHKKGVSAKKLVVTL